MRNVIETFEKSVLGFYKVYGETNGYYCLLNHTPEVRILVVFACSSASGLSILSGSCHHKLYAMKAVNGSLRVPDDLPTGVTETREDLEHGGMYKIVTISISN